MRAKYPKRTFLMILIIFNVPNDVKSTQKKKKNNNNNYIFRHRIDNRTIFVYGRSVTIYDGLIAVGKDYYCLKS